MFKSNSQSECISIHLDHSCIKEGGQHTLQLRCNQTDEGQKEREWKRGIEKGKGPSNSSTWLRKPTPSPLSSSLSFPGQFHRRELLGMASVQLGLTGLDALLWLMEWDRYRGAGTLCICSFLRLFHCIFSSSHLLYLYGTLQIKPSQNVYKNAITLLSLTYQKV
ncbi:hypothetical protein PO909_031489 [Leuciscus waleckii]